MIQLLGFSVTTMTVHGAIGYAGLGAGVHESGEVHRDTGITKQGRRDLRRVMVVGRLDGCAGLALLEGRF